MNNGKGQDAGGAATQLADQRPNGRRTGSAGKSSAIIVVDGGLRSEVRRGFDANTVRRAVVELERA